MNFEFSIDRTYPHPVVKVWDALIDSKALGEWLMETDFEPKLHHEFRMTCVNDDGGKETYRCKVLVYDPPRTMRWSWALDVPDSADEMFVDFVVESVQGGTKLTITHSGRTDPDRIEKFKGGWPARMQDLAAQIR